MSFFAASKSYSSITHVLDSTCHVVLPACTSLMSSLAASLKDPSNCGTDLQRQNPVVQQAYSGLVAYPPLYQASCLRNPQTNHYCFADAVTNMSSPSDSYTYYLPLGMQLPSGSMLTCSSCLQQTMGIFDAAAANRTQPVSAVYSQAAQLIDLGCGPAFVNQTVPQSTSLGFRQRPPLPLGVSVAIVATMAAFVQTL